MNAVLDPATRSTSATMAARASRPASVTAGVGVAGALTYGTIKAVWTFGGRLGVRGEPHWETGAGGWAKTSDGVRFLAFEGTVLLSLAAIAVLLALVRPWGRRLPRRPLAVGAWLGCVLVGGAWLAGTIGFIAGDVGPGVDPELTPVAFWAIWASFGALGGGFGATAWLTRPRRAP